jgi:hypothetical protein
VWSSVARKGSVKMKTLRKREKDTEEDNLIFLTSMPIHMEEFSKFNLKPTISSLLLIYPFMIPLW